MSTVQDKVMALLLAERAVIDDLIRKLGGKRRGRPPATKTANGTREIHAVAETKKRGWTKARRDAHSKRMRDQWKKRRVAEGKAKSASA